MRTNTCFVLNRTFCPARVTANTWQSYGKSVVVAYVVPRVCTTCIRSATCLYSTKITAKTWLYQQEQTYPQSGLPRPHKATVRPSHRQSTPARRPGLVLIRFVPCLHPPCALVGLDGRPSSSRDFAWPRCFAHAWPFQRRWVYAGYAQMIALAAPVGVATAPASRILSCFISCETEMSPAAEFRRWCQQEELRRSRCDAPQDTAINPGKDSHKSHHVRYCAHMLMRPWVSSRYCADVLWSRTEYG